MPKTKYIKPKNRVAFYYEEKELIPIISKTLKHLFPSGKTVTSDKTALKFYTGLCAELNATRVLMISEQFPLNSLAAHGRFDNVIYQVVSKTGTQYARKHVIPKNPRTAQQTQNRDKMKSANLAWHQLSPADKAAYNQKAKKLKKTGHNLFVSEFLLKS